MNFFFCDINGTFTGNNDTRQIDIINFVNNLKKIIEKDNLDNLVFCFVSTNKIEDVIKTVRELTPYIDDNRIIMGKSFGDDKSVEGETISEACLGKLL